MSNLLNPTSGLKSMLGNQKVAAGLPRSSKPKMRKTKPILNDQNNPELARRARNYEKARNPSMSPVTMNPEALKEMPAKKRKERQKAEKERKEKLVAAQKSVHAKKTAAKPSAKKPKKQKGLFD